MTEVTPNLCFVFTCANLTRRNPLCGSERRRERGLVAGFDAGDLDPESDTERSFFERKPPPGLEARAKVSMRRGQ